MRILKLRLYFLKPTTLTAIAQESNNSSVFIPILWVACVYLTFTSTGSAAGLANGNCLFSKQSQQCSTSSFSNIFWLQKYFPFLHFGQRTSFWWKAKPFCGANYQPKLWCMYDSFILLSTRFSWGEEQQGQMTVRSCTGLKPHN